FTEAQRRELHALAPRIRAACQRLADYRLPYALEHGDLNPFNIRVAGERVYYLDWTDSAVSHPFFSLARLLLFIPTALSSDHPLIHPAAALRLRDAYLEPWTAYEPMDRLIAALALAQPLAALARALNYSQLDFTRRGIDWECSAVVPGAL